MAVLRIQQKEKRESNSNYVYRVLRENIMTLHLKPGTIVDEPLFAELLLVSRTPVREALFRLKQEHLVDIIPQKESSVSLIDFTLVHEALFLRSTLETTAVREASLLATPAFLTALEENLHQQQSILTESESLTDFFLLDNSFHQMIYTAAGMENLWHTISTLSTHYDRLRYLDILAGNINLRPLYISHRNIYQAIADRKTQQMEEYLKNHLYQFLSTKIFLQAPYRSYFFGLPEVSGE